VKAVYSLKVYKKGEAVCDVNKDEQIDFEAYRVAKETRAMEIGLFWQRSNYFLVLNTGIAIAFFSLRDGKYAWPLALFGIGVSVLWFRVNLGSKFWQNRWEHRARLTEENLRKGLNLFSASLETVEDDVRQSFEFRKRWKIRRAYEWLVLSRPSVSLSMTGLTVAFAVMWLVLFVLSVSGHWTPDARGSNEFTVFLVRHEHELFSLWPTFFAGLPTLLAVVGGAVWGYYKFRLNRLDKPVLEIALAYRTIPDKDGRFLAWFDATFTNKSQRKVQARKRTERKLAFSDKNEDLEHSCSLLLRRVDPGAPAATQIRWFPDRNAKSPLDTDIKVNLLTGYEYDAAGKDDFYIEPSEAQTLSVGIILEPGVYIAMITFVGPPPDDTEFWRREIIIQIPEANSGLPKVDAQSAV
jgi:hypothetical protein